MNLERGTGEFGAGEQVTRQVGRDMQGRQRVIDLGIAEKSCVH